MPGIKINLIKQDYSNILNLFHMSISGFPCLPYCKQVPWKQLRAWGRPTKLQSVAEKYQFEHKGMTSLSNRWKESTREERGRGREIDPTCCFKLTLSYLDFLVKFDKNDKGKTKAALPTRTSPNSIELSLTDFAGLKLKGVKMHIFHVVFNCLISKELIKMEFCADLSLTILHRSMSKASIPT